MTGSSVKPIKWVTFICKIPLVGKYDFQTLFSFFEPPFYGVFYKITVVCLSVHQFDTFLGNCSLVFYDIRHDGR